MPTAADVNAIQSRWSLLINEADAVPNKYNFDNYNDPGCVVSVSNYAGAQSIANIPEKVPGKLYVLPLRTDDQDRNDLIQEYHTVTGNVWCRPRYYYSSNTWGAWSTSANCSDPSDGNIYIAFGGMHICAGAKTWTNVNINAQTAQNNFCSGILYFSNYKKSFSAAPKCVITLTVGSNGPYWLFPSTDGPTATRPQGFRLCTTINTTVSTVTANYIAIGISS